MVKESNGLKKILIGSIVALALWTVGIIFAAGAFRASTNLRIERVEGDCADNKKTHETLDHNIASMQTDIAVIREQLRNLDPRGARRAEMNIVRPDTGR